jgi:hypothetical protein
MTSSNQLKQVVSINKKLEVEEPMHCWRQGCKEELNGLMHYWIDMGNGFVFDMWLCGDCTEKFKKTRGDKLRFLPILK